MKKTAIGDNNILVLVRNGRYDVFGDPKSKRAKWLTKLLAKMGGVSEDVDPGYYVFSAKWRWNGLHVDLTPLNERS